MEEHVRDEDPGFRAAKDGEPPLEDFADYEKVSAWVGWAQRRIAEDLREIVGLHVQLSSQRSAVNEAKRKVDAYEEVLKARAKILAYEPGRTVHLVNAGGQEATILDTILRLGGVVYYRVGWWTRGGLDGWTWHEATLSADQIESEMPLLPPKP